MLNIVKLQPYITQVHLQVNTRNTIYTDTRGHNSFASNLTEFLGGCTTLALTNSVKHTNYMACQYVIYNFCILEIVISLYPFYSK